MEKKSEDANAMNPMNIIPVADIGITPNVLVVTNSLPAKNISEFLAYVKKNPGKINYGSGGVGSAGHLAMEMFEESANFQATHVPYKGSGPALNDIIAGHVNMSLPTVVAALPHTPRLSAIRKQAGLP